MLRMLSLIVAGLYWFCWRGSLKIRGIFGQIDARDVIAVIGLSLLAAGLYQIYWPAALIVPGAILCWYALWALRYTSTTPRQTDDGHTD